MSENTSTPNTGGNTNNPPPRGIDALRHHFAENKLDMALWASRFLTIIFFIGYVIPIFGNAQSAYYKVLMANAATSAIRLHQRLPPMQFTKQYLGQLLLEDSCHYLFFSLIYLYVSPMLMILFPVVIFAVLHTASYSLTLLDLVGQNTWWAARLTISIVELQTRNMLRFAAFAEIMLMPLAIILVFTGRAGIMTPFIYYHFLNLRYASRRNPHTRNVFYELRLAVDSVASSPKSPAIISKILRAGIAFVSRLAPPTEPVHRPQQ